MTERDLTDREERFLAAVQASRRAEGLGDVDPGRDLELIVKLMNEVRIGGILMDLAIKGEITCQFDAERDEIRWGACGQPASYWQGTPGVPEAFWRAWDDAPSAG